MTPTTPLEAFLADNKGKAFNLYAARAGGTQVKVISAATPDEVVESVEGFRASADTLCRAFEVKDGAEDFTTAFAVEAGVVSKHADVTIPSRFW